MPKVHMPVRPPISKGPPPNALCAIEAAAGAGILMGRLSLVAPDLLSGRLWAPFDLACPIDSHLTVEKRVGAGRNRMLDRLSALLSETRVQPQTTSPRKI